MRERFGRFFLALRDWAVYLRFQITGNRALDYVSMGLGIQARYRRHARFWKPHLEQSREFLRQALGQGQGGGAIAVLGAGRLYDFPQELLSSDRWQFDLYDYDPALLHLWKRRQRLNPALRGLCLTDLTGVMEKWHSRITALPGSTTVEDFARELEALPRSAPAAFLLPPGYEWIVSLNLLSQLGLYLRDRVELQLVKRGLINRDSGEMPSAVESALRLLAQHLEAAHLRSIREAAPRHAVLICDTSYLFYTGDSSRWEEHPALQIVPEIGSPYRQLNRESWFWHIAPQGGERSEFGEIHEVCGKVFSRDDGSQRAYAD